MIVKLVATLTFESVFGLEFVNPGLVLSQRGLVTEDFGAKVASDGLGGVFMGEFVSSQTLLGGQAEATHVADARL